MHSASTVGVAEPLKFKDPTGCRAWLSMLPLTNVKQSQQALLGQLKALTTSPLSAQDRLSILETLREPVAELQLQGAKRFRNRPVPLELLEAEAWSVGIALWRSLAEAFEGCLTARGGELPENARFACQRAIRYLGCAMFDHARTYRSVAPESWSALNRLYAKAESAGYAGDPVADTSGRTVPITSCTGSYLHVLLTHLANPSGLAWQQMDMVDRWLDKWEGCIGVANRPFQAAEIPPLAVDLDSSGGVRLARELTPSPSVRFIDTSRLAATIRQMAVSLRQGSSAIAAGLGKDVAQQELLLAHLFIQWCSAGTGRMEPRVAGDIKVTIAPSVAAAHYQISGKVFREPDAGPSKEEERDLQLFGHVTERTVKGLASQRSSAVESWQIVNQSSSGVLGLCRDPESATRINHGQMVAMIAADGVVRVGLIQRLLFELDGHLSIGLRIIGRGPVAIAVRQAGVATADGRKWERALLLPADVARKMPQTLLLLPGWYQSNRVLELQAEHRETVRLQRILEYGANFERVVFSSVV